MKILFAVSSSSLGFWLAEFTHPFWHFSERNHEIEVASPKGGKVTFDALSDPASADSWEKGDLVSKGFLTDPALVSLFENTLALSAVDVSAYDAIHVVGGGGAAIDLYPDADVKRVLSEFVAAGKIVGTICHGSIALANNPEQFAGRAATGFSRAEDAEAEKIFGKDFIPNFPEPAMEAAGIKFMFGDNWAPKVVIDGRLITGQNQQSASEYAIAFNHLLAGTSPVHNA